ncbi:TPA: hypothetical protein ACJ509_002227 [Stenotrophomonas maltophilia]
MSIHINPATNPFGQDINGPLTTSRLLYQRQLCSHTASGSARSKHRPSSSPMDPGVRPPGTIVMTPATSMRFST